MDERLKYITDNFDNLHIGLDDTFRFHCDQCGKCCIDREDILLNPKDVFNISRELELTPLEAFDKSIATGAVCLCVQCRDKPEFRTGAYYKAQLYN